MGRFGVAAGRAGVDLTVGRLAGPRWRVEVRGDGPRPPRSPAPLPQLRARRMWIPSFRQDPPDEPVERLEPDEISLGVYQRTTEGTPGGSRSQVVDGRSLARVPAERDRPSGGRPRLPSLRTLSRAFVTKDTNAHNL